MPASQGRDLGSVAGEINKIVADAAEAARRPATRIQVVGQIESMNDAFRDLGIGLLFAAVFVYLLMVVNYQNFGDPFVVILALPATFCGIVTMLFITGTTLSVPSLMGAIMAVGVASANSILLVTFAREQQLAGMTAFEAAIAAGHTRIRPVLMTAAAMIVGMIPMAIGGAGEEQNAALARAVIGGLLFATPTTLLVVPYLFALLRKGNDGKTAHGVFARSRMIEHERRERPRSRRVLAHARRAPSPECLASARLLAARRLAAHCSARSVYRHCAHGRHRDRRAAARLRSDGPRRDGAGASAPTWSVTLPGTTSAFAAANIFARASGYIDQRNVDIGDHVKAGQLLAEITAPELDHQIAQAEATLAQLRGDRCSSARPTASWRTSPGHRDKPLVEKGWVPQQQGTIDEQTLAAQEAAVRRRASQRRRPGGAAQVLHQQKIYQSVVAPFDGVITQRNIDVGSLVQADATTGTFMFTVDTERRDPHPGLSCRRTRRSACSPASRPSCACPRCPTALSRHGDAHRRRAAARDADAADRDRHPQSGRRADARHLLHGRAAHSAQDAEPDRAGRRHHLQCRRPAGRRGRERRRPPAQDHGGARPRHGGRGARRRQGGDQVILNPSVDLVDGAKVQVAANPSGSAAAAGPYGTK